MTHSPLHFRANFIPRKAHQCLAVAALLSPAIACYVNAQDDALPILIVDQNWKAVHSDGADEMYFPRLRQKSGIRRFEYEKQADGSYVFRGVAVDKPTAPSATSPDGGTRYVANVDGKHIWAHRLNDKGEAIDGTPFAKLRSETSVRGKVSVSSMIVDDKGRIYVSTETTIQFFDPEGRLCGSIALPGGGDEPATLGWGVGKERCYLVVNVGNRWFARKLRANEGDE